ncbi:aminotransferase class I/II-fold pyridoxal phosphate-dependent enzyme [Galbibacter sp.]|uniref:aminotransferase class I/II-fold pyridoxal phosphate-dependent enzyme n=1 Tax=Galbibacter sp. TaxID=2918471 RepID=UPI003A957D02
MTAFPENLLAKIQKRKQENALRVLTTGNFEVDFSSNDYLGFSHSTMAAEQRKANLDMQQFDSDGSTGSRLLTGNHKAHENLEQFLAKYHSVEAALVFNSGYDANLGFFSAVPQRGDIVIYDAFAHASIRDGIQLSNAKSYKFKHNDLEDLKNVLQAYKNYQGNLYVVTESVFSMDGDSPDLKAMIALTESFGAYLVVDEAHAVGVFGEKGEGMVQSVDLNNRVFARIVTFGKALGCHGAAVLGSELLKVYLYNFARSFMYTTALSPHSIGVIYTRYGIMGQDKSDSFYRQQRSKLLRNIEFFKAELKSLGLDNENYLPSNSAIQCLIVPGNEQVKKLGYRLNGAGFDVRPILSPTVPMDFERIRFCLHSFNTFDEISGVLKQLIP